MGAIGYVTPRDKLHGLEVEIWTAIANSRLLARLVDNAENSRPISPSSTLPQPRMLCPDCVRPRPQLS